jgi:hypothetical protein
MKTIVVIFNGITLPFQVIEFAIDKAKKDFSEIYALFLKGSHEPSKGYIFPSDLGTAENWASNAEVQKEDEAIIWQNMKMVRKMVEIEEIPYREIIKTNASIDEVAAISEAADLIVVDENFDNMSLLSDNKISLRRLMGKISKPIEVVPEKK